MHGEAMETTQSSVLGDQLFKPSNWLTKIEFINHLVLLNSIMTAVIAEHGGGKTTFIKVLSQELDENILSHVFNAAPRCVSADLLSALSGALSLDLNGLPSITSMVEQINKQKKHFLLVIDDAQNLPLSLLQEFLTEIERHKHNNFFHVCLVSDFSIVQRLCVLDANQFTNMIHSIELGALTENETNTYLLEKSKVPFHINKTNLEEFYNLTGGNIARINSQMNQFFRKDTSKDMFSASKSKKSRINNSNLFSMLLVASLVSAYIWHINDRSSSTNSLSRTLASEEPSLMMSHVPSLTLASVRQPLQSSPLNRVVKVLGEDDSNLEKMVVMDKVVVIPKAIPSTRDSHASAGDAILLSSLTPVGALTPKISAPLKTVSSAAANSVASTALVRSKDNAVSSTKGQYTIQLLASQREAVLRQFIAIHHLKDEAKINVIKQQGVNWYVLTLGEYNKVKHAKLAMDQLPAELAIFRPWIRPLTALHELG